MLPGLGALPLVKDVRRLVLRALGYTPYDAANPAGYITGITGPQVTTALGYTPYDATNPSGYQTSGQVSSAIQSAILGGTSQTWQVVTGSRAGGATYTNSTGRPIQVLIAIRTSGTSGTSAFVVDFTSISNPTWSSITSGNLPIIYSVIVRNGETYRCDLGGATIDMWSEMR